MPSIEISSELYVRLQQMMERPDRTPSDVIWRLVQEHDVPRAERPTSETGWSIKPTEGLSTGGTVIPNGLRLRGRYGRTGVANAEVREGVIKYNGGTFESPSSAAIAASQDLGAKTTSVNGWRWWEYEMPGRPGDWRRLDTLRHEWQVRQRRVRPRGYPSPSSTALGQGE